MKTLAFFCFLFTIVACSNPVCIDTNCEDYTYQEDAQAALYADPDCRGDLDHDNDDSACEHLPHRPSSGVNCPTTANCGCSNKPMSECEADPCCQWIVGSGCECA